MAKKFFFPKVPKVLIFGMLVQTVTRNDFLKYIYEKHIEKFYRFMNYVYKIFNFACGMKSR